MPATSREWRCPWTPASSRSSSNRLLPTVPCGWKFTTTCDSSFSEIPVEVDDHQTPARVGQLDRGALSGGGLASRHHDGLSARPAGEGLPARTGVRIVCCRDVSGCEVQPFDEGVVTRPVPKAQFRGVARDHALGTEVTTVSAARRSRACGSRGDGRRCDYPARPRRASNSTTPSLAEFCAAAEELGAAVLSHPWGCSLGERLNGCHPHLKIWAAEPGGELGMSRATLGRKSPLAYVEDSAGRLLARLLGGLPHPGAV